MVVGFYDGYAFHWSGFANRHDWNVQPPRAGVREASADRSIEQAGALGDWRYRYKPRDGNAGVYRDANLLQPRHCFRSQDYRHIARGHHDGIVLSNRLFPK